MTIIDRFSTHLKNTLARSIHVATELQNVEVLPIHLFFSLLSQKGSVAAEIIHRFHIKSTLVEETVAELPSEPKISDQKTLTPLSLAAKTALEKAMSIAQENRHNYIGTEHLLYALIKLEDSHIQHILDHSGIKLSDLEKQLTTVLGNASQFPQINDAAEVMENIQENLQEELENTEKPEIKLPGKKKNKKKDTALDFFATQLTSEEAQKNIDPVIGRENEIERVVQILCRRTKNNPVLLGEPGVGKTAIVEGLAKKIYQGDVPDLLLNKKIYSLDMGMLIAGTIYRGEFEARLRQVMEEVTQNPDIIIFIDELHNIVGAGSNQGTMDAGNILKPALARGQIRCIGATTPAEFKKYIESDAALERRFQSVYVKEPSSSESVAILKGIRRNYESYHHLHITDDALEAAVSMSERYLSGKFLPDKAIDILDEAAAAKRLTIKPTAWQTKLWKIKQKLEKTILAKETATAQDQFEAAVKLKAQEKTLRADIKNLEDATKDQPVAFLGKLTATDIAAQIGKITGAAPSEIILAEKDQLQDLPKLLKQHIVGQDPVIDDISKTIRQARLGLSDPHRPLASFLFVGESGVGKTELAKILANTLYPNKNALIKLDMSEFSEGFGVSKLLGSPAGYVGYKENNQFTDRVKMNPYSVILFDEIDKAHKEVTKLLLQMLENGEITDSTGRKVSLRHTIIILTTSFGAEDAKKAELGFGGAVQGRAQITQHLLPKLKEHFSTELINRLDRVCIFEPLQPTDLTKVAALELHKFNDRLQSYQTTLKADNETLEWLVKNTGEKQPGARDIRREVRKEVEQLLAEIILQKKIKSAYNLRVEKEKLVVK